MLELLNSCRSFGGVQRTYSHHSETTGLTMRFSIFMPERANNQPVPALFFLAGLTCTEEAFPIKAGAQRYAALHGIAIIAPDTSPRGAGCPGEEDNWDLGVGAGFYVDATETPWSKHYRMYSYIHYELRETILRYFPIDDSRIGIFGHSMGGHGALVLALRNPEIYRSVSAFAPITAPTRCTWGRKAFSRYLGDSPELWKAHDGTELVLGATERYPETILIDQGLDDRFLSEQLNVDLFEQACAERAQPLTLRRHSGYDHGYYFVSTFMGDHVAHHARLLKG